MFECRIADSASGSSTDTDTTSPQTDVQNLVGVLISALQNYQAQQTPSNTNTTVDLAAPEDSGDGSEPEPVIDALLGDTDPAL